VWSPAPVLATFFDYRDHAYLRDGLGQLNACDAILLGRATYENFAALWPDRDHPWADRINAMTMYLFSSTLERVNWNNSTLVQGDAIAEVTKLKAQDGGDLLVYGHGLLAESLLQHQLLDVLDVSVHPVLAGTGNVLFRPDLHFAMNLVAPFSIGRDPGKWNTPPHPHAGASRCQSRAAATARTILGSTPKEV